MRYDEAEPVEPAAETEDDKHIAGAPRRVAKAAWLNGVAEISLVPRQLQHRQRLRSPEAGVAFARWLCSLLSNSAQHKVNVVAGVMVRGSYV